MPAGVRPARATRDRSSTGLGARIRELRLERGLTQAQLAGGELTKGFISMVETGRARLSIHSAQILADRLGIPVGDLLREAAPDVQDLEIQLLRAEQDLLLGDARAARSAAEQLAPMGPGALRARFRLLHGRALLALGQVDAAIAPIDEAIRAFRALGARESYTKATFWLAQAHLRSGAHSEALQLLLRVDAAIAGGAVVEAVFEAEVQRSLAVAYAALGVAASVEHLDRARRLADDSGDPHALATRYRRRAEERYALGDRATALSFAHAAFDVLTTAERDRSLITTWLGLSRGYLAVARHDDALAALDRAADLTERRGLYALFLEEIAMIRAEAHLGSGDTTRGLEVVRTLLDRDLSAPVRAAAVALRARLVSGASASLEEVHEAFARALQNADHLAPRERAAIHRHYADALAARGAHEEALTHSRRAVELVGFRGG